MKSRGGNRVSTARLIVNLFIVWALTGLWHGADWAFVLWGLLFFVCLVFEKYTGFEKRFNSTWLIPLKYLYAMLIVVVGWVLFKAGFDANTAVMNGEKLNSLALTGSYLQTMFGFSSNALFDDLAYFHIHESRYFFLFAALFSFPIVPWLIAKGEASQSLALKILYDSAYVILFSGLFIIAVSFVVRGGYNPFIYFNF